MFRKTARALAPTARALALTSTSASCLLLGTFLAPVAYTPAQALYNTPLGQLFINRAANASALAGITAYAIPVMREDLGLIYRDTGASCTIQGGDGGWQIQPATGHCWMPPKGVRITPAFYENVTTATDDTSAIKASVATGQTVYLAYIGRSYVISSDIPQSMSGQVIEADSRIEAGGTDSPTIFINATGGFTKGVFVSTAAEPGPTYRNLSILFSQPDPGTGASAYQNIRQYVPAFFSQNVARTRYEKIGCYLAWLCIDQRGAGGWYIDDMQTSSFSPSGNILIDAALDSVRIHNLHQWVFGETANMQSINGAVGQNYRPLSINAGRVDGLYVDDSLFFTGLGVALVPGTFGSSPTTQGNGFGSFTNCDFDTYGGVYQQAGDWHYVADDFTMGAAGATGFQIPSGTTYNNATMSASRFFKGATTSGAAMLSVASGNFNRSALNFNGVATNDGPFVLVSSGVVSIGNSAFIRAAGTAYTQPTIFVTGGRVVLATNTQTPDAGSGGSGTFILVAVTNGHTIVGNSAFGYSYSLPTATSSEYYAGNR